MFRHCMSTQFSDDVKGSLNNLGVLYGVFLHKGTKSFIGIHRPCSRIIPPMVREERLPSETTSLESGAGEL